MKIEKRNKGILIRRSLAQTPPVFMQNQTEDAVVIIEVDQSVNKLKNDQNNVIKVAPKYKLNLQTYADFNMFNSRK